MKISYILQMRELCIILFFGFIMGILYEIINLPNSIKKVLIIQIIIDIIACSILTAAFVLIVNVLNQGEMRLFLLIGYLLGFIIERITLRKLFAKFFKYVYTFIVKGLKSLYNSKFGRIIFK